MVNVSSDNENIVKREKPQLMFIKPNSYWFMVDLETLGTLPGYKIMTIGVNVFNAHNHSVDTFYIKVDRENQYGLKESEETITWWDTQSDEAKAEMFGTDGRSDLKSALLFLNDFIRMYSNTDEKGKSDAVVLGNGSDFDNAFLQVAYKACKLKQPWEFYNNRCYRTIKSMAPHIKMKRTGTHHNALDDAISQTKHLLEVIKYLENRNGPRIEDRTEDSIGFFAKTWNTVREVGRRWLAR